MGQESRCSGAGRAEKGGDFFRNFFILSAYLCMILLLTACLPERTTESPASGELTIYTNMDEGPFNAYLTQFKSQYPEIQVNAVRGSTGDITAQLLAERENPQADVIWGLSATVQNLLEWHDVLEPYAPVGLERVSASFRDTNNPPYWVGFGAWMAAICINTEKLTNLGLPVPESWAALADPIYKDQVVMSSPVNSSTGYSVVEGLLEIDGEIKGWEYLDALHENILLYTEGSGDACDMVGSGEVAIGIANDQIAVEAQAGNPSIEMILPTEGVGWDVEANSLVRKDVISPVALTFLDWAISDAAMQAYAKDWAILSVALESFQPPPGFPPDPATHLLDKDFPWASANRDRISSEWRSRYGDKIEGQ